MRRNADSPAEAVKARASHRLSMRGLRLGAFAIVATIGLGAAGPAMALAPPTAVDDHLWLEKDKPHSVSWASMYANDIKPTNVADFVSLSDPLHGTIVPFTSTPNGPAFFYTPEPGYTGPDSMSYVMQDPNGTQSNIATITITVTTASPTAGADSYEVEADMPYSAGPALGVLVNDNDPDGDALSAQLVSAPGHGSLSLQADGGFSYTPAPGYQGIDHFSYLAVDPSDGRSTETSVQLSVVKFVVTVIGVNFTQPPPRPAGFSVSLPISIVAQGAKKGMTVELLIDDLPAGSAITDLAGAVTIPFDYPATLGSHTIEARAGGISEKVNFTVLANLAPEVTDVTFTQPAPGVVGTASTLVATVTGANGPVSGVTVKVYSDNDQTGTGATDVDGTVTVGFFYPGSPGQRTITVIAGNRSMQLPVTVLPVPPPAVDEISFPAPAAGEAGSSAWLIASITSSNGVLEDAPLELYIDGGLLSTRSTNSLGNAAFPFVYPTAPGAHTIEVTSGGKSSGPLELVVLTPVTTGVTSTAPAAATAGRAGSIAITITSSGVLQTGAPFALSIDGKSVTTGLTDLAGKANVSFTYPATVGPHAIEVTSGTKSWKGTFSVLAPVVVAPASAVVTSVALGVPAGKPGQTVYLVAKITSSTAAKAGATVIAYIDGKKAASKTTDATGTAKIPVKLPSPAGKHTIRLVAGSKATSKTITLGTAVTAKLGKLKTVKAKKAQTIAGSFGTKSGKVTIKVTDPKGKVTIKTVSLGSTGKFSYKYTTGKKGKYKVSYSYVANAKYYGAKSYTASFTAK